MGKTMADNGFINVLCTRLQALSTIFKVVLIHSKLAGFLIALEMNLVRVPGFPGSASLPCAYQMLVAEKCLSSICNVQAVGGKIGEISFTESDHLDLSPKPNYCRCFKNQ